MYATFDVRTIPGGRNEVRGRLRYENLEDILNVHEFLITIMDEIIEQKRCLFALENGMLGSGPLDMEVGDEVYLLGGVLLLMVLQDTGTPGELSVVGPAYVHGMMEGETIRASTRFVKITLI
ncbi:hypothetical protein QBC34DRAFT_382735 [Podospora aff. communis PSN243]|uniref:Uncharacterized protein n=1 Tax=Podospora aff. communis PSN243 TaxID=3040156 RepID=A0AAV9GER3_9PEZI|nr:hypothetical protein QBC34DRAFT_382735 [Podospora aff. communis PSN243]